MRRVVNVAKGEQVRIFNHLELETNSRCNRRCVFCPNHQNERPNELMPMLLIEKAIDELAAIRWKGVFVTYIYNEPLLDPRFETIARMAATRNPSMSVMVSTNGDPLTGPDHLRRLFDAGVRQVHINVYGDNVPEAERRYAKFTDWAEQVGASEHSAIYDKGSKNARNVYVEKKFGEHVTLKRIGARFELENRSGNISWFKPPLAAPLAKMCTKPFRVFNINWKGQALLCCHDYHGQLSFGNLRRQSLVDIWNGERFNHYRLWLQNKRRSLPLCATCDFSGGYYQHEITAVTFGKGRDTNILRESGHDMVKSVWSRFRRDE